MVAQEERRTRRNNRNTKNMDQGMSDFIREVFNSEMSNVNSLLEVLIGTVENNDQFSFTNTDTTFFDRVYDHFERNTDNQPERRRRGRRSRNVSFNLMTDLFDNIFYRIGLSSQNLPYISVNNIFTIFTISLNPKEQPKTVSKEDLSKIKKEKFNLKEKIACPICYCDFKKNEEIRNLDCKHIYHRRCVDPWLLNNSDTCPVCRKAVIQE